MMFILVMVVFIESGDNFRDNFRDEEVFVSSGMFVGVIVGMVIGIVVVVVGGVGVVFWFLWRWKFC